MLLFKPFVYHSYFCPDFFFLFNLGFWFVCLPYFFQGGELSETGAYQREGGDGDLQRLWNVVVI